MIARLRALSCSYSTTLQQSSKKSTLSEKEWEILWTQNPSIQIFTIASQIYTFAIIHCCQLSSFAGLTKQGSFLSLSLSLLLEILKVLISVCFLRKWVKSLNLYVLCCSIFPNGKHSVLKFWFSSLSYTFSATKWCFFWFSVVSHIIIISL